MSSLCGSLPFIDHAAQMWPKLSVLAQQRHMSYLCGSLPFIDHAAQMRMDDITETDVEIETEPSNMESWKSQIQMVEKAMVWFKQGFLW